MHLNVNKRVPLARTTEEDFVIPFLIEVVCCGAFDHQAAGPATDHEITGDVIDSDVIDSDVSENEYLVGRIWAAQLDWSLVEECRQCMLTVCDAAGAVWMEVLGTLTRDAGGRFRRELHVDDCVQNIVFIHELLIHPDILQRVAVMDAAIRAISDPNSLVLMHYEQSLPHHLDDWEYRDLGFKKIARSNLLMRDNHLRYPFGETHPGGRAFEFIANAEHDSWVRENWDNLVADHPAR